MLTDFKSLKLIVSEKIAQALVSLAPNGLPSADELSAMLEYPPDTAMGDLALPCFKLAKTLRKGPPMIAAAIKDNFKCDFISKVETAGGYLIQLLPGADESVISAIERGISRVGAVSAKLDEGASPLSLLQEVLSEFELEVLETTPVEYRCYCSRERVSRALISMGKDELTSLIEEQNGAELTCQFCDKIYNFSGEELKSLLDEALQK